MNKLNLFGALSACIATLTLATSAQAATINLSYQFDLDLGSQFEIGGIGSGLSIYRTALDNSQSFAIEDGDTVNVAISFLNNKALLIENNASAIGAGTETIGLELISSGLGLNTVDTVIDITGFSGVLTSTQFLTFGSIASGVISPSASGNYTNTSFILTDLSISFTVLSGISSPVIFDSTRLAITAGTPIGVVASPVPVPAAIWFFGSALLSLISIRRR